MVNEVFKEIASKVKTWDDQNPDKVSREEFKIWYADSTQRINGERQLQFSKLIWLARSIHRMHSLRSRFL